MTIAVELHEVTKRYGKTTAIQDLSIAIEESEFFVILGPSGAGKTTTLKSVAGLVDIDAGVVRIAGRDMAGIEPYHRRVAMAFESYALYPQKTVAENLASPLRSGRTGQYDQQQQKQRIDAVTNTLGISELQQRFPRELSNGQRQRTVLGRVLVRPADVYLLDEPLSHLDAKLRAAMRSELKQLADMTSTTTLYVTHDYQEALALGNRVAVLNEGRLIQVGTPEEVWRQPVDTFVAKTLGQPEINLFDADVDRGHIKAGGGAIEMAIPHGLDVSAGDRVRMGIRPRDLEVGRPGGGSDWVRLEGSVRLSERLGRSVELTVRVGDVDMIAVNRAAGGVNEGDRVELHVHVEDVHLFAAGGGDTQSLRSTAAPAGSSIPAAEAGEMK